MIVWIFQQYFHFAADILKNFHNLEENVRKHRSRRSRVFPGLGDIPPSGDRSNSLTRSYIHSILNHSTDCYAYREYYMNPGPFLWWPTLAWIDPTTHYYYLSVRFVSDNQYYHVTVFACVLSMTGSLWRHLVLLVYMPYLDWSGLTSTEIGPHFETHLATHWYNNLPWHSSAYII